MLLAFVAFNPSVFAPQTWRYLADFAGEDLVTHHGYLVMNTLYQNTMAMTPHGTPWFFYLLFLGVKVPLPILVAFLIGLVEIFRHRGPAGMARGYLFLRIMLVFWLFPMAVAGSKFLRYTLSLMPVVYMTAAIGIFLVANWSSRVIRRLYPAGLLAPQVAKVSVVVLFVAAPTWSMLNSLPYPSLYLNSFGGGRVGYFFPHDEFYDLGARESIKYIADTAPPGSCVASEIPGVVQYYLERFERPDIRSEIMSHPNFSLDTTNPDYILLQRGRMYFENRDNFRRIELTYPVIHASTYGPADAVRVHTPATRTTQSSISETIPKSSIMK
jgi:hypothetical protein